MTVTVKRPADVEPPGRAPAARAAAVGAARRRQVQPCAGAVGSPAARGRRPQAGEVGGPAGRHLGHVGSSGRDRSGGRVSRSDCGLASGPAMAPAAQREARRRPETPSAARRAAGRRRRAPPATTAMRTAVVRAGDESVARAVTSLRHAGRRLDPEGRQQRRESLAAGAAQVRRQRRARRRTGLAARDHRR